EGARDRAGSARLVLELRARRDAGSGDAFRPRAYQGIDERPLAARDRRRGAVAAVLYPGAHRPRLWRTAEPRGPGARDVHDGRRDVRNADPARGSQRLACGRLPDAAARRGPARAALDSAAGSRRTPAPRGNSLKRGRFGRGSWIRTNDLQYPKLPRYQAALYPDHWDRDVDTRSQRRQQGAAEPSGRASAHGLAGPDRLGLTMLLVRMQAGRPRLGMDLSRHHALGARPEADQHILARAKLGHAEAAQRLHMHEDVRRALPAGQEAETAQPVEPFDLRTLETTGRCDRDMGARRQHLRRMDRRRFVHREDAESLVALGTLHTLADEPRSLVGRLVAVAPKHRDVKQHVRPAIVRNDEAIPLRGVEPFDDAGYFDEIGGFPQT